MPVIPKNYADLLETKALAHVATIGPKGEPQNTPVWFGWDGNHVLLTMTKTAQKYLICSVIHALRSQSLTRRIRIVT
jgi:nitroimidazol reductase NimA-like FMN-containing flavoprotein (pyridoxamine 5'-phosphate oxidase superfamily)